MVEGKTAKKKGQDKTRQTRQNERVFGVTVSDFCWVTHILSLSPSICMCVSVCALLTALLPWVHTYTAQPSPSSLCALRVDYLPVFTFLLLLLLFFPSFSESVRTQGSQDSGWFVLFFFLMLCLLLAICGGVGSRESEGDWGHGKDVCCVVFGSEEEMLEVSASEIRRVSESQDGLFVDLALVRRAFSPILLTRDRWLGLERRGGG